MIRIELGREASMGVWEYAVPSHRLFGKSRQPLLDACRQIKRMGGPTGQRAGLFREGKLDADLSCGVEWGAGKTVSELSNGNVKFEKYRAFEISNVRAA